MRTPSDCLDARAPKKVLACDGGGILGLISVEILARLEAQLREASGRPDLVLGDWFDFVCGTSTGAILAACISAGMPMSAIRSFYVESGAQMFDKSSLLARLKYAYDDEPLAAKLRAELNRALGDAPDAPPVSLGDPRLRTLLMMVLRNHSTDSPWPVSNNPRSHYNQRERPDCNLDLPLWQLVRASTAAPTYFPPEVVRFGNPGARPYEFVFVDGGVTTYNNPAFLAFQMVTAAPYRIQWPTGVDRLLIVSVGTGSAPHARPDLKAEELWVLDHAKNIPGALMNAASAGWDTACRLIGQCRHGRPIDRELRGLLPAEGTDRASSVPPQFAYVRYDPDVTREGLDALGLWDVDPAQVQRLDSVAHIPTLQKVGQAYAGQVLRPEHLRGFLPAAAVA